MSKLCDSWTKRDDDKAETSRMGDDNEEIVEIDDNNEVNSMNVKVNPPGHKPRMYGCRWFNKTTQELGGGRDRNGRWYSKKTKMSFLVVLSFVYIHV